MIHNPSETTADATRAEPWPEWRDRILKAYAWAVGLATFAAFFESFHNLIAWFHDHGFHGIFAWIAPAMVDVFILGGEALVLLAVMENWGRRPKVAGWTATVAGLAVSVAGNIGAAPPLTAPKGHPVPLLAYVEQIASYAAAPMALAGLSALGMMIVKRVWKPTAAAGITALPVLPDVAALALFHFREALTDGTVPSVAAIKKTVRCAQPKAIEIRDYLRLLREEFERHADEAEDAA